MFPFVQSRCKFHRKSTQFAFLRNRSQSLQNPSAGILTPARTCIGSTRIAPILCFSKSADLFQGLLETALRNGKISKIREASQLFPKGRTKMFAVSCRQCAVAKSMIRAFKRNDAAFPGGEKCGFECGFHSLNPELQKIVFPDSNHVESIFFVCTFYIHTTIVQKSVG